MNRFVHQQNSCPQYCQMKRVMHVVHTVGDLAWEARWLFRRKHIRCGSTRAQRIVGRKAWRECGCQVFGSQSKAAAWREDRISPPSHTGAPGCMPVHACSVVLGTSTEFGCAARMTCGEASDASISTRLVACVHDLASLISKECKCLQNPARLDVDRDQSRDISIPYAYSPLLQ